MLPGSAGGAPAATGTADLSLTKSDSPDPVTAGGALTYTIKVANAGPDAATGVVVTDNLPKGVSFVSANSTQGSCAVSANKQKVTCALGTIGVTVESQLQPFRSRLYARRCLDHDSGHGPEKGRNHHQQRLGGGRSKRPECQKQLCEGDDPRRQCQRPAPKPEPRPATARG